VVGLISNATGNRGELLQWVLNALDVPCDMDAAYVSKFQTLQDFVIGQYSQNRHVVLIIDEAQNLSIEGLEELRMLTNINSNKDELLQLILVGQPELREMITRPSCVSSRSASRQASTFPPWMLESTRAYIRHRLQHAAGSGEEFTDAAIDLIWEYSRGIPRLINKLADFSMVYASHRTRRRSTRTPSAKCSTTTSSSRRSIRRRRLNEGRDQVLLAAVPAPPALDVADRHPVHRPGPGPGDRLPAIYETEARLLVEAPQISDDLVNVTVRPRPRKRSRSSASAC
jgi:hypothetical protein